MPLTVKDGNGVFQTFESRLANGTDHRPGQDANLRVAGADVANANAVPVLTAHGTKVFTAVTATTTAGQLLATNALRKLARIYNNSGSTVFVGKDATITAATGFPLIVGASLIDEHSTDAWFAITSTATADVRLIEVT